MDPSLQEVEVFSSSGAFLGHVAGPSPSGFGSPSALAIDPSTGDLYVADAVDKNSGFPQIDQFTPGGATLLRQWGQVGSNAGQMNNPTGLAIDPSNHDVYVLDGSNFNVQQFDPTGNYIGTVGTSGMGTGQLEEPSAIAIDANTLELYVTDPVRFKVVVFSTIPTISTLASISVPVGGQVSDTATLAGGATPTGSIAFKLYGPNDPTCAGTPISSSKSVSGNGDYTSDPMTPTAAGTYRWIAAYSGDAGNRAVTSACNDPNESVTVTKASPAITTNPPAGAKVGSPLTNTATLSGGFSPTGTITFELFGPGAGTCSGTPAFSSTVTVSGGNTNYVSGAFTATKPGSYRWLASYSGDANNNAASSSCAGRPWS